jgi:hypothetical protein
MRSGQLICLNSSQVDVFAFRLFKQARALIERGLLTSE